MAAPQREAQITEMTCDVFIAGGGLGGVAAALRAARMGRRVCLIEETGWLGGQISTQGVSHLDEHRYIETFGGFKESGLGREGGRQGIAEYMEVKSISLNIS